MPEKAEVTRLGIEASHADDWCDSLRKYQRGIATSTPTGTMKVRHRAQNKIPNARTKEELTETKAEEERLAECKAIFFFVRRWQ